MSQDRPPWVDQAPTEIGYYYGIARIKIQEENYLEKADNIALRQISKQINTQIYFKSKREVREVDDIAKSRYDNLSSVISISELPGAEKVDTYQNKNEYHVYWRMNKEKHGENINKNKKSALRSYKQYRSASKADPAEQLSYLVPCLESMERALGVEFIDPENQDYDLRVEVPKIIDVIMTGFTLDSEKKTFTGMVNQSLSEPVVVTVAYRLPSASNVYGPSRKTIKVGKMPIGIQFTKGNSELASPLVRSDKFGNAMFEIVEIGSKSKKINFTGFIDLKQFRLTNTAFYSFDDYLDRKAMSRNVQFSLLASEFTQEVVAVIVNDDDKYFNSINLKKVKTKFRNLLKNTFTSYEFKQDLTVQKLLDEYEREGRNVCTDIECQIEIGSDLQVNKLIFVDIIKGDLDITLDMVQTNIDERKIEYSQDYTFEIPFDIQDSDSRIAGLINEKAPEVVDHFWGIINPGRLSLQLHVSNVTALIENLNPSKHDKAMIKKRLERNAEQELIAGEYRITLNRSGFEETTFMAGIGRNKTYVPTATQVELNPKTRQKAFYKSLLLPGTGQMYTSEAGFESRKYVGWAFSLGTLGFGIATVSKWLDFNSKKTAYDDAYKAYLNQNLIENVNTYRHIAEEKNEKMYDAQMTAIVATTMFVTTWIGSAFEARMNFPLYGTNVSSTGKLKVGLDFATNYFRPKLVYTWHI